MLLSQFFVWPKRKLRQFFAWLKRKLRPQAFERKFVELSDAQRWILDGDLLLWRRRGLISIYGRGEHSHAAKAAWWDDTLMAVEVRELVGGRAVTLESQVERYRGRIDVFRTNPDNRWPWYGRCESTRRMKHFCNGRYGYWNLFRAFLLHVPIVHLLVRPAVDDNEANAGDPYCSQACAESDRTGGVDPVLHLADRLVAPSDLARSPFYQYLFTLIPDRPGREPVIFHPWAELADADL